MPIHFARRASSLAIIACVACSSGGSEGDIRPAESPDAEVIDASPGPSLAEMWRDHPMFRSGSRLRARALDGDGDAVAFIGFRDMELARDCEFVLAGDGERRCLPVAVDGSIYYLDSACTQPVFRQSAGSECKASVGPYAKQTIEANGECARDHRTRVYDVGAPRADGFVYAAKGSECNAFGMLDCLHAVAEIEPARFARGRIATESNPGFAIDWIESDDGSRAIAALRDTIHDLECSVQPQLRPEVCLPVPSEQVLGGSLEDIGDLFSGQNCSAPMAALDLARDACTPAAITLLRQKTVCGTFTLMPYELGAAVGTGFARTDSGCAAFKPAEGQHLYSIGDPLDEQTRPALRLARGGSERLAVRYYATADGVPVQYDPLLFYDRDLAAPCEPQAMSDGTLRCVPGGATVATDPAGPFADADCSDLLVAVPLANLPNACGLMPEYARRLDPATTMLAAVHNLEPKLRTPPDTVYFFVNGACSARKPRPSVAYQRLGNQLQLAVMHERLF